jgi:hypothetical protein
VTTPDPLVDRITPTVADIHDRWIRSDWWGRAAGEHKVQAGQDHHVLEGLRHARTDVAALLARQAAHERLETAVGVFLRHHDEYGWGDVTPELGPKWLDPVRRAMAALPVEVLVTTSDSTVSELGQHYGTTSHRKCGPPTGHTCHQPSGRTCYEQGCTQPAGTHWGPMWCPDCDARRLDHVSAGLNAIRSQIGGAR